MMALGSTEGLRLGNAGAKRPFSGKTGGKTAGPLGLKDSDPGEKIPWNERDLKLDGSRGRRENHTAGGS